MRIELENINELAKLLPALTVRVRRIDNGGVPIKGTLNRNTILTIEPGEEVVMPDEQGRYYITIKFKGTIIR